MQYICMLHIWDVDYGLNAFQPISTAAMGLAEMESQMPGQLHKAWIYVLGSFQHVCVWCAIRGSSSLKQLAQEPLTGTD